MRLDVVLDGRTAALISAARATKAAEHLPADSAKALVALSTGTRLYLQANQRALARRCLDEIEVLLQGVVHQDLADAYEFLIKEVRKALTTPPAPPVTRPTATR